MKGPDISQKVKLNAGKQYKAIKTSQTPVPKNKYLIRSIMSDFRIEREMTQSRETVNNRHNQSFSADSIGFSVKVRLCGGDFDEPKIEASPRKQKSN